MIEIPFGELKTLTWIANEIPAVDPVTINPRYPSAGISFLSAPCIFAPATYLEPLNPTDGGYPDPGFVYCYTDTGSNSKDVDFLEWAGISPRLYETFPAYNPSRIELSGAAIEFRQVGVFLGSKSGPDMWDLDGISGDETALIGTGFSFEGGDVSDPGFTIEVMGALPYMPGSGAAGDIVVIAKQDGGGLSAVALNTSDGSSVELDIPPLLISGGYVFQTSMIVRGGSTYVGYSNGGSWGIIKDTTFIEYTYGTNGTGYIPTEETLRGSITNVDGPYFYMLDYREVVPDLEYEPFILEVHCEGLHYNVITIEGGNQAATDILTEMRTNFDIGFQVAGDVSQGKLIIVAGEF